MGEFKGTTFPLRDRSILHQEALCANGLQTDLAMVTVTKTMNSIRASALNHPQIAAFL
jgi:hypothetical protein